MNNLPEKFPEYLIMYKILSKKISNLEDQKIKFPNSEIEKIQKEIEKYESERIKIINKFPENFFKNYDTKE
jgi:hypothetical protein